MIPFLCQTLLELIYVIFIIINNTFWDDPASASIFAGIARMILNDFIHKKHGYSSSIQNSLVKVTASASTDFYRYEPHFSSIFLNCVKSVQIRSYFWSVFSCIQLEFGLRIWTLFTQK